MRRILIITFAAFFLAASLQAEGLRHLSRRVFELARTQYSAMDGQLGPDRFPRTAAPDGSLVTSGMDWWCSGFYPGALWYIYEGTQDEDIRMRAEKNTRKLASLPATPTHHDIGFQLNSSFGNAFLATGDSVWLDVLRTGAVKLAGRFNTRVGCTMSWNPGRHGRFPVIIDNMMNLELLMRSARVFGIDSLRTIAITHARTTMRSHFREDGSTVHLVDFDPETGEIVSRKTVQGTADASRWARGQAWALYGYTMMARECAKCGLTEDSRVFREQACRIARWMCRDLPSDGVPYWDFDAPGIPDAPRDASAAAIMASALLELSSLEGTPPRLSRLFRSTARRQIRSLASEAYLAPEGTNAGFLLRHCTGNLPAGSEVDVPLTYADYYFLEALLRL